jgi:hypothetical protein
LYGGGGGGGGKASTSGSGGAGAQGLIIVTYNPPVVATLTERRTLVESGTRMGSRQSRG